MQSLKPVHRHSSKEMVKHLIGEIFVGVDVTSLTMSSILIGASTFSDGLKFW